MKRSDCIRAAQNDLVYARLYLEYGEAINWVTGRIGSAMNWAMECWLISKGHKIGHGRGWESTLEAFLKNGSLGLRSRIISLYSETMFLDFELMGNSNTKPTLSMDDWKDKAYRCLEKTEQLVHELLAEIEPDHDMGMSHRC